MTTSCPPHYSTFIYGLVALVLFDMVWLSMTKQSVYAPGMGSVMKQNMTTYDLLIGSFAWVFLTYGLYTFVLPHVTNYKQAFIQGSLFSFLVYGVYQATNAATLRSWNMPMPWIDLAWGTVLGGMVSLVMAYFHECSQIFMSYIYLESI